jgi:hypothetical protein
MKFHAAGRRTLITVAASVALALTATLSTALPASAGAVDHGRNPAVSYGGAAPCNSNSTLIGTRPIENIYGQSVSTVQIFYSYSCQTNWIRVTSNPAGGATIKKIATQGGSWLPDETDYGTGSSYSMQVYAPGSACVDFQVELKYPNGTHYAETYIADSNHQTIC